MSETLFYRVQRARRSEELPRGSNTPQLCCAANLMPRSKLRGFDLQRGHREMKKATIKDVAREAGVAVSTVSNALNGSNLVTEETRNKVLEAARKLEYVPNMNGRNLKSSKTGKLCCITSSIRGEYFYRLFDAINESCNKKNYGIHIIITRNSQEIIRNLLGGGYDGFFLFEGQWIQEQELETIRKNGIKAVMLDRKIEMPTVGSVVFDSYRAGYEVTKYLINLGHKKIGFIESASDIYDCSERKRGYLDAMREFGIMPRKQDLVQGMFEENVTYAAIIGQARISHGDLPTAYVAGNDQSAVGCLKALDFLGYKVPDEISVAGFDDIEISQYFSPALTTVRNPIEEQGRRAVDQMLELLEDRGQGKSVVLHGSLIVRGATGVCRK